MGEIRSLITRFENAVHQEAMAEARDASDRTLERLCGATKEAREALTIEFKRLQQRVLELETQIDTKAGYL